MKAAKLCQQTIVNDVRKNLNFYIETRQIVKQKRGANYAA